MRLALWLGLRNYRSGGLSGTYRADATIGARTGFAADTQLPEWGSSAAPELSDSVATSLVLAESAGIVVGTYADATHLTCALSGTLVGDAVTVSGACGDFTIAFSGTYSGSLSGTVTIGGTTRSATEPRTFPVTLAGGAAVSLGTAYYVDSVAGNDSNSGTEPGLPVATISGAATAGYVAGDTLRLARGSLWREEIAHATAGVADTIEAYGVGPRPYLTAFDQIAASDFTLLGGTTNVYRATVTVPSDPSSNAQMLPLALGTGLVGVADSAACDAMPGSYVRITNSGAGTYDLDVHLADSGAPADDEVEVTTRLKCVAVDPSYDNQVTGIGTRGAISEDGCITGAGTAVDVTAVWGHVHNAIWSNGVADIMAVYSGDAGGSRVLLVGYASDGAGRSISFSGGAIGHPAFPDAAGLLFHTGAGAQFDNESVSRFGSSYTDTYAISIGSGAGATASISDVILEKGSGTQAVLLNSGVTTAVDRVVIYSHVVGYGWSRGFSCSVSNVSFTDVMQIQKIGRAVYTNGAITALRTLWAVENDGGQNYACEDAGGSASYSSSYCVYVGGGTGDFGVRLNNSGADWTSAHHEVAPPTGEGWQRNLASGAVSSWTAFLAANSDFTDCSDVAPSYEVELDSDRPVYRETLASVAARGYEAGPSAMPSCPVYELWRAFVDTVT